MKSQTSDLKNWWMPNDFHYVAACLKSKVYHRQRAAFTEAKYPSKGIGYLNRVSLGKQLISRNPRLQGDIAA